MSARRLLLLAAVIACAALHLVTRAVLRVGPVHASLPVTAEGSFRTGGWYPGEPFATAVGVKAWGSWSGSDDNQGALTLGPFPAPRILRFGASGYPGGDGNSVRVELVDGTGAIHRVTPKFSPIRERWDIVRVELPAPWLGRPIRIVARDDATGIGGWFGLSEPVTGGGRGEGNHALLETLDAAAINALLLGVLFFAAAHALRRNSTLPAHWIPLAAGAVVAAIGYVAFWAYFSNSLLGVFLSWTALAVALIYLLKANRDRPASDTDFEAIPVGKLILAIGAFYLALLHLFPTSTDFYTLAAHRYRDPLPADNQLSHAFAERLFAAQPVKDLGEDWQFSDRPPLQTGWQLLTWSAGKTLGVERRSLSGTAAVWFQLLWIAGAWGLLRSLRVERARAAGWIAVIALTGFCVQSSVYTWPKLAGGGLMLGAFAVLVFPPAATSARARWLWVAMFAGLAWLTDLDVGYSLFALAPWVIWRAVRDGIRAAAPALVLLALLALPWLGYQRLYDPPGDRPLRFELAGQTTRDGRGLIATVHAAYAKIGWRQAFADKAANAQAQVIGHWRELAASDNSTRNDRRDHEFFHTSRALTWWPLLALIACVLVRPPSPLGARDLLALGSWLILTIAGWCLLLFGRGAATLQPSSFAVVLGLFVVLSAFLERRGRAWLGIVAALQTFTFVTTWTSGNLTIAGPANGLVFVLGFGAIVATFIVLALRATPAPVEVAPTLPTTSPSPLRQGLKDWWHNPRITWWLLFVIVVLLFLRKPDALHTPQIYAEDGSIFLNDQEEFGLRAVWLPYMGYLHALPRLIAWIAAQGFDPQWWPAIYNGLAFAVWVAVVARFFSARFNLPGKPWLALAFVLVPHTGEVFFTITNLQWLTAFVLVQQVIIAAPKNRAERYSDLAILAVIALTGPFGAAFLPLFAWRWWRARQRDNLLPLLVVLAGAAVQAWFVLHAPKFDFQSAPLQPWPGLIVLARRLVGWPLFGRELATELPPDFVGIFGTLALLTLFVWTLRPHPRRELRVTMIAALGLITAAGFYRARPDTWAGDNIDFGDRYFYMPRVLLAWLLIWEFDHPRHLVANLARVTCLVVAVVHLWTYTLPAPPDYEWAKHVEPIRQGVRGDIPILPPKWTLEYRGRPKSR